MNAEAFGTLRLDNEAKDPSRSSLVETVIDIIAKDLPTEIVQREVDLLRNIHLCTQKHDVAPATFANGVSSMVARYSVRIRELDGFNDRQFAVLIIQNANLSNDTRSSLIFMITTDSNVISKPHSISVSLPLLKKIASIINDTTGFHPDIKNVRQKHDRVSSRNHSTVDRVNSAFDLNMVSSTLGQIKISLSRRAA